VFWNARARHTQTEATSNHPVPAQVTGGKTTDLAAEAQDDLWRFDVATRTWADLTAGRQPRSRYLHSAATWATAPPLAPSERPELGAMVVFSAWDVDSVTDMFWMFDNSALQSCPSWAVGKDAGVNCA